MDARAREERGDDPATARARARREFGNLGLVAEVTREMWGRASFDRLRQDVAQGLRLLRRYPAFGLVSILCIGLGIGVTTTIFSAVNGLFLQPLPYQDAGSLVVIHSRNLANRVARGSVAWPDMEAWRDTGVFSAIGVWSGGLKGQPATIVDPGSDPEPIVVATYSPGMPDVLRMPLVAGRSFLATEQVFPNTRRVLLGHALWQRRYGGDRGIIGKTISLAVPPVQLSA
jgi:hypothetical protein